MALNPSGAISLAGPVAGQSIALELGLSPTATISLNDTAVRTLAGVPSGTIIMPNNFWGKSSWTPKQRGLFWGGRRTSSTSTSTKTANLISNTGVVASDTSTAASVRYNVNGANYGGDKALFIGGNTYTAPTSSASLAVNYVSNTGVMAGDSPALSGAMGQRPSGTFGSGQAMFAFGGVTYFVITDTGVVGGFQTSTNRSRTDGGGTTYGQDKIIFAFGNLSAPFVVASNFATLVSNTGVIGADFTCAGSGRRTVFYGATYGTDKAIFYCGFGAGPLGPFTNQSNLVSNTGVMASDTPGVGTARSNLAGTGYGGDKAIFGFGFTPIAAPIGSVSVTNLVSNTGVVSADTPGVGTARTTLGAASYSYT